MPILLIFIDGFGLGSSNNQLNPFTKADMPFFQNLLCGGLLTQEFIGDRVIGPGFIIQPTDTLLGVDGIPQSATGQTAFLTGINTARIAGRHIHGFPTKSLREVLNEFSIFKVINNNGLKAVFANTFTKEYFETVQRGKWRHSSTTTAAMAGRCSLLMVPDLIRGESVYQDITNEQLLDKGYTVPLLQPEEAAENLIKIATKNDFTLFEYFQTDRCGHSQDWELSLKLLHRIDRFISSLVMKKSEDLILLVISDHGNIEDLSIKSHTKNPIPTIIFSQEVKFLNSIRSLPDIYSLILHSLAVQPATNLDCSFH